MRIQRKPFRIYIEKYHVEGGNIYPPRYLNLKRIGLILLVVAGIVVGLSSCTGTRNGYRTGITNGCFGSRSGLVGYN